MGKVLLTIKRDDNQLQEPIVLDGITWETAHKEQPSKLTFTVVKDDNLSFSEGAEVTLSYDNANLFFGYVFTKTRNKDHHIEVTAYDQLRYLQAKSSYRWVSGVRADQVVKRIADDFRLKTGVLTNTGFVISKFEQLDQSLFDMIQTAIDETVMNTNQLYYLYDDYGLLKLKNIKDSVVPIIIDKDTAEDFDYKTSIDSETYNRIVIAEDSEEKGQGSYQVVMDESNAKRWGVLQYFEAGYKGQNALNKAKTLLKLHNQVSRSLTINGCLGDTRVRAGTSVYVDLNLGDQIAQQRMLVEKATHTFDNGHHYMSLSLIGCKEFYG